MSADQVLEVLHEAGLSIALTPEQGLRVTPASALTTELRDLIRASKTVLIDLLERMKAANDTTSPWCVSVSPSSPPDAPARLRAASLALDKMQAKEPGGYRMVAKGQVASKVSTEMRVSGAKVAAKVSGETEVPNAEVRSAVRTETQDFDRWAWPNSAAMNGAEIDLFTARLHRFTDKGLNIADGESLADKLVVRDREADDRRFCLECRHLSGHAQASWRCGNWQAAGVAIRSPDSHLPADLVLQLQRCHGFTPHPISTLQGNDNDHNSY